MAEKRTGNYIWVDKLVDLLKHDEIPTRLVWLIYFAAKQRLMIGKVRRKED